MFPETRHFFLWPKNKPNFTFESFVLEHATKVTGYKYTLSSSMQLAKTSGCVVFSLLLIISDSYAVIDSYKPNLMHVEGFDNFVD